MPVLVPRMAPRRTVVVLGAFPGEAGVSGRVRLGNRAAEDGGGVGVGGGPGSWLIRNTEAFLFCCPIL